MSHKKLLILAFALIVLANLLVLGRVAMNRAEVVSELTLSERELSRSYQGGFDGGTALELRWRVNNAQDYWTNNLSVNPRVLKDLGFGAHCTHYGNNSTERKAYVLMELEGKAWQNAKVLDIARLNEQLEKAKTTAHKKSLQRQIDEWDEENTRLYVTAVAAEAKGLMALIHDGGKQFILPARVKADCNENQVYIRSVSIERLNVNLTALPSGRLPAKYQVKVAVGMLGDAWITKVEPR